MNGGATGRLFWRAWTTAKEGNSPEQNEDVVQVAAPTAAADGALLIVIADGASETVYSRAWARTLVEAVEDEWTGLDDGALNERLAKVRRSFAPIPEGEQVPWYIRNKFQAQGSQATLLAVCARESEDGSCEVRAIAVGDCCLLLFRRDGDVSAFPVHTVAEFGLNPALVASRGQGPLEFKRCAVRVGAGDLLLVCTDAVGKWALQCLEEGQAGLLFDVLAGLVGGEEPVREEVVREEAARPDTPEPEEESLLHRIWHWMADEPEEEPAEAAVEAAPEQVSPEAAPKDESPKLDFEAFIRKYREPEGRPHMRNDDSTLVVCGVLGSDDGQQLDALAVVRALRGRTPSQASPLESAS